MPNNGRCRPKVERFLSHVNKTEACWLWRGALMPNGYGHFTLEATRQARRGALAHRAAWMLLCGPIPPGLNVLHRCDVRACVRPDHLFIGTQSDNIRDMVRKGRQHPWDRRARPESVRRGERVHSARLTAETVVTIRSKHAAGHTLMSLSREFGVLPSHVHAIIHRRLWKHV